MGTETSHKKGRWVEDELVEVCGCSLLVISIFSVKWNQGHLADGVGLKEGLLEIWEENIWNNCLFLTLGERESNN